MTLCKVVMLFPSRFIHCSYQGVAMVSSNKSQGQCVLVSPWKVLLYCQLWKKVAQLGVRHVVAVLKDISALFGLECGSEASQSQAINFLV